MSRSTLTIFAVSFLGSFLMVSPPYIGIKPQNFSLISPQSQVKIDSFEALKPKLERKTSFNFKLNRQNDSFIKSTYASEELDTLNGYGVIDLDTGEVIESKNLSGKLPIASITKIMTAAVSLDLLSSDYIITIKKADTEVEPTNMGLIEGQKWQVEQLLNALLLTSSNDAAESLKNEIDSLHGAGTFIKAMNFKAESLSLKNTQFQNPQGYDSHDHYSSVEDLTILSKYIQEFYPLISKIVETDYQFYASTPEHNQADLYNWNGLLGVYPGVRGIKIGNTGDAQKTTVVISERGGKRLLAVVLGAPGVLERDLLASKLLDLGFEKTLGLEPANITEEQLKAKYQTWKYF